ncbi:MAG: hypothetical protein ABI551_10370, partial [Polyangiaceae bacterium]
MIAVMSVGAVACGGKTNAKPADTPPTAAPPADAGAVQTTSTEPASEKVALQKDQPENTHIVGNFAQIHFEAKKTTLSKKTGKKDFDYALQLFKGPTSSAT